MAFKGPFPPKLLCDFVKPKLLLMLLLGIYSVQDAPQGGPGLWLRFPGNTAETIFFSYCIPPCLGFILEYNLLMAKKAGAAEPMCDGRSAAPIALPCAARGEQVENSGVKLSPGRGKGWGTVFLRFGLISHRPTLIWLVTR